MTNHPKTKLDQSQLDVISDFEKNLEGIFFTDTRVIISPLDDALIGLAIEVHSNFSLSEIISLLKMSFDTKYRAAYLHKVILLFQNSAYTLNQSLITSFDIEEISMYFKNTSITIHSIGRNSLMEELEHIIYSIVHHYDHYSTLMGQMPNEIHIPVIEDPAAKELFNKNNSVRPPVYKSPYFEFWGLYFDSLDKPLIYNLNKTIIIPGNLDLYYD